MRVPRGGSMCANCVHYNHEGGQYGTCESPYFQAWKGDALIPVSADEYCCDHYDPIPGLVK